MQREQKDFRYHSSGKQLYRSEQDPVNEKAGQLTWPVWKTASTCFSTLIFTHEVILTRFLENMKHGKSAAPDLWTSSLFVFPYLIFILYILCKINTMEQSWWVSKTYSIKHQVWIGNSKSYTFQFRNPTKLSPCKPRMTSPEMWLQTDGKPTVFKI